MVKKLFCVINSSDILYKYPCLVSRSASWSPVSISIWSSISGLTLVPSASPLALTWQGNSSDILYKYPCLTSSLVTAPLFIVFLLALLVGDWAISTLSTASSKSSEQLDSESVMVAMRRFPIEDHMVILIIHSSSPISAYALRLSLVHLCILNIWNDLH